MIQIERVNPFVSSVLDAIDRPSQIDIAAELLHEAEIETGVVAHYSTDEVFPEINDEEWCKKEFRAFMNATHLVITGGDLMNMVEFVRDDGQCEAFSWRSWGATVADWANAEWVARPGGCGNTSWLQAKRPWEYLDFYDRHYLSPVIAQYDLWADTLLKVIQTKSQKFPFNSQKAS